MSNNLFGKIKRFEGGYRPTNARLILKSQEIAREYNGELATPEISEESLANNVITPSSGSPSDWGLFKNNLFNDWEKRFSNKFSLFNKDFFDKKKIVISDPEPDPEPEPSPIITKVTSATVRATMGNMSVSHWLLEDKEYYPAVVNLLVAQMKAFKVSSFVYDLPDFDCGNFSFAAKGVWNLDYDLAKMATFIVWVSFPKNGTTYIHALNACVADDGKFYLIEPQNDKVYSIPSNYKFLVVFG